MVPTSRQIAYQLAVLNEAEPGKTIKELADKLGFSPIFIINALEEGERMELFNRDAKKNKINNIGPLDYLDMDYGVEEKRLAGAIVRVIASANEDENDVESKTLEFWCIGINPEVLKMCVRILKKSLIIESYELSDPKDKKSKYTFYSLEGNAKHQWGRKQFKKK